MSIDSKVEEYDYGKFAWITDPEGNSRRAVGTAESKLASRRGRSPIPAGRRKVYPQPVALCSLQLERYDLRLRAPDLPASRRFAVIRSG